MHIPHRLKALQSHIRGPLIWTAVTLALLPDVSTIVCAQSQNLLSNASFENTTLEPWQLSGVQHTPALTDADSVDGFHSLSLRSGQKVVQQIRLEAGIYELRTFVRPAPGQTAHLSLSCLPKQQSAVSTATPDPSSPRPDHSQPDEWKELHAPVLFLSHSADCNVTVQVSGSSAAPAFVDSVSLTRHQNLLANPQLLHGQENWEGAGIHRAFAPPLLFDDASGKESSLYQTIRAPSGSYILSASYRSSGGQILARLEAKGCADEDAVLNLPPAAFGDVYRRVQLRGIRVETESCTIGVHVLSAPGTWLRITDMTLERESQPYRLVRGGDVSLTDMVEEHGGTYKVNGVSADPFRILAASGMNLARLHLFVDPGNPGFSPSNKMRGSYDNLSDVLHLAARANSEGMNIELSLHLSDYWADGGCQTMPHAWLGLTADALVEKVATYVSDVLRAFNDRGISVHYIAMGNEADAGLLRTEECNSSLLPVNADATRNPDLLARVLEAGYRATHELSPQTLVLWHLANIGRYAETRRYLDAMLSRGAHVDVIAYSAYPFWSDQTIRQFQDFANYVTTHYHRPVFFEETGYPWTPAAGADNMNRGGPEPYPLTPRGQLDFLNDEISAIESSDEGRVIGFSYWDATWIPAPNTFDNVDNYVLFDREGNVLPALTTGFQLSEPRNRHIDGKPSVTGG